MLSGYQDSKKQTLLEQLNNFVGDFLVANTEYASHASNLMQVEKTTPDNIESLESIIAKKESELRTHSGKKSIIESVAELRDLKTAEEFLKDPLCKARIKAAMSESCSRAYIALAKIDKYLEKIEKIKGPEFEAAIAETREKIIAALEVNPGLNYELARRNMKLKYVSPVQNTNGYDI